jgi:hypothetical protein
VPGVPGEMLQWLEASGLSALARRGNVLVCVLFVTHIRSMFQDYVIQ